MKLEVYEGMGTGLSADGQSGSAVVSRLVRDLYHRAHDVVTNNFFSSVRLFPLALMPRHICHRNGE